MAALIEIDHVAKLFVSDRQAVVAVRDATLEIAQGSFVSVVGPSGCGKSTLLGMIAGLTNRAPVRSATTAARSRGSTRRSATSRRTTICSHGDRFTTISRWGCSCAAIHVNNGPPEWPSWLT